MSTTQLEITHDELMDQVRSVAKDVGWEAGAEAYTEEREKEKRELEKAPGPSEHEANKQLAESFRKALQGARPDAAVEAGKQGGQFSQNRHLRHTGGYGYKGAGMIPFLAAGKYSGELSRKKSIAVAEKAGREDIVKALEMTDYNAGGALIPNEQSADIIEALYSSNVVIELGANTVDMSGTRDLSLGKQNGTSTFYWIGEGASFTVSEQDFGEIKLQQHKGGVLVPISNDLLDVMPSGMDALIRNDMVAVAENGLDLAYLRGDGGGHQPLGIRNALHTDNEFDLTDGATNNQVAEELLKLQYLPTKANIPMQRPGWVFHPRTMYYLMKLRTSDGFPIYQQELSNGTLFGAPVGTTTQMPINLEGDGDETEIMFGDFAQVVVGDTGSVQIDESSDASFLDSSGSTVHGFTEDVTLVRLKIKTDIALRHNKAFAVGTGDWGKALD